MYVQFTKKAILITTDRFQLRPLCRKFLRDSQINQYLNVIKLNSTSQFGIRAGISTIDALHCTESFRCGMHSNKYVTAAFLDLSEAFDSIQHDILEAKLRQVGFDVVYTVNYGL